MALCLCGCRLGGKYVRPQSETPCEWKTEVPAEKPSAPYCPLWWDVFNDPILSDLEIQAINNSPNLQEAVERVVQARAFARVDRAALYPQVNLTPSYSNQESLFKLYLPGNVILPDEPLLNTPYRVHQLQYVMPFNLKYEIDLWGKLRGKYESDKFAAESEGESFCAALLSLTGDVANNYFILRQLDSQLAILDENIELLRETLSLARNRFQKGLTNEQAVLDSDQQLSDALAGYCDLSRQRALQENIIATLIGTPASLFHLDPQPLYLEPPTIPPGLPSEILLRRPDIAAAERSMASQHALIGVAYASFFPSLELTTTLGYLSPDLSQFMTWKSRLWILGANAAQTIFDAGRNQANLDLTYAQFRQSVYTYQQQVLTAFKEVEDALADLEWQEKEFQNYRRSLETSKKRVSLLKRQYSLGYTNNLNLISSELTALQARLNVVNALGRRYQSTVQLIKALGVPGMTIMSQKKSNEISEVR